MSLKIIFMIFCFISLSQCTSDTELSKITPAVLGEFPHMGFIGWKVDEEIEYNCMGSLINPEYVLTAAHCTILPSHNYREPDVVLFGAIDKSSEGPESQKISVQSIHRHPAFVNQKRYNDIALLKLKESPRTDAYVKPACISKESDINYDSLVGSGREFKADGGLKKFSVVESNCDSIKTSRGLLNGLADYHICTKSSNMISGSSIQTISKTGGCKYDLIGFATFGSRIDEVYVKANSFNDWINSIIENK